MITRSHIRGDAPSTAIYSDCERYRYALTREWDAAGKRVLFIMLNPSKATEVQNDPTVERCERRARTLGFGAFRVVNIFAWRETDPTLLKRAVEPVGADNDAVLADSCGWANQIICGWGAHGDYLGRGAATAKVLRSTGHKLFALGLTQAGHPRHPLYIAYRTQPEQWSGIIESGAVAP